jgi:ribosomal protein S12 methylthiotransferase accessory factor
MSRHSEKRYTFDAHRTVPPSETLARVRPFLSTMGITRVANVTGLDRIGIPVVMVSRPCSRSVSVAQGKGLTLEAAKASGVMEALETWHAERISLPVRYGSLAELRRDAPVAEVERLPRVAASGFSEHTKLLWIEGTDLATGEKAWLPFEMVHTDYTVPRAPGHGCFPSSSNGLASGNDLLEATCHAICEVIERDATSIWHHLVPEAQDRTKVRPETVDDEACRDLLRRISAAGLDHAIFDTSTDVEVASFRCVITEGGGRLDHIGIGDGCHPHRGIALVRAITEAVQTRMTYVSGARDDIEPCEFGERAIEAKCGLARALIERGGPVRDFRRCPHHVSEDFEDDLALLLRHLRRVGCDQVIRVDLTRPDIGVPVVRVVVPGLEAPHDDEGYVPGPRATATARAAA